MYFSSEHYKWNKHISSIFSKLSTFDHELNHLIMSYPHLVHLYLIQLPQKSTTSASSLSSALSSSFSLLPISSLLFVACKSSLGLISCIYCIPSSCSHSIIHGHISASPRRNTISPTLCYVRHLIIQNCCKTFF